MATNTVNDVQSMPENWQAAQGEEAIRCSIGIMA